MTNAIAGSPKPSFICPLCGGANACAVAGSGNFDTPCWCSKAKIDPAALARIPVAQRNESCICERCATLASAAPAAQG